jgi:hypothetical protein
MSQLHLKLRVLEDPSEIWSKDDIKLFDRNHFGGQPLFLGLEPIDDPLYHVDILDDLIAEQILLNKIGIYELEIDPSAPDQVYELIGLQWMILLI